MKYIYHHLGLGDHIICNGLVRSIIQPDQQYSIFCKPQYLESIKFMYRDLSNLTVIPLDDYNPYTFQTGRNDNNPIEKFIRENNIEKDVLRIGFGYLKDWNNRFDEKFYEQMQIPFRKRWEAFYVKRDIEAEQNLFKKLGLKEQQYIFLHDDFQRGYCINNQYIINKHLPVFTPDTNITKNIFDYLTIIKNAREIHCIDSCFRALVDTIKLNTNLLFFHNYARSTGSPMTIQSWTQITNEKKQPLKIYPNTKEVHIQNHLEPFIPYWGQQKRLTLVPECPDNARYDDLLQKGKEIIQLSSLQNADFVFLPEMWTSRTSYVENLIQEAKTNNKKVITFFESDSTEHVDLKEDEGYIFRTSFYKSKQRPNERALPAWSKDFIGTKSNLDIRPKSEKPIASFCGYINSQEKHDGCTKLLQSGLPFIFKQREKFHGHTDPQQRWQNRKEYVDIMKQSDYIICARGGGNFSYRFYEALSFGKIPIFINSDCVLPFDNIINYKDFCVWIEPKDIQNLANILIEYHAKFTNEEFGQQQVKNRVFWENYLSPMGFLSHIKDALHE